MRIYYKIFFLFFICLSSLKCTGQCKLITYKYDVNKIPKGVEYKGRIKDAISWVDKAGRNIVFTCETGLLMSRKSEIYAYHYLITKNLIKQNWKLYDLARESSEDFSASFIKNTLQITDLNNDGIGEVWIMYRTTFSNDQGPCEMKVIMFQGKRKFKMCGLSQIQYSKNCSEGGAYSFDKPFIKLPKFYREFAKKIWDRNVNENDWNEYLN